jgi:hypothetical protein
MGIGSETYSKWKTGKTEPVAPQFRPVVAFLGYDSTLAPETLSGRLMAKRGRVPSSGVAGRSKAASERALR